MTDDERLEEIETRLDEIDVKLDELSQRISKKDEKEPFGSERLRRAERNNANTGGQ